MELAAHALSSAASLATISATIVGGAALAGKVPRAGPLRALVLGFTSRFGPLVKGATVSQRDTEVERLRASLAASGVDQFVVVNGPKGVGESGKETMRIAHADNIERRLRCWVFLFAATHHLFHLAHHSQASRAWWTRP
jgi:hypothetical protein